MASYRDLLPAGAWPTQPFVPPYDPMQTHWAVDTTPASPSPRNLQMPWERAPVFSPYPTSQYGAGAQTSPPESYSAPDVDDPARYQRMADEAKRTYDAAMWAFGPPSVPQAPSMRQAPAPLYPAAPPAAIGNATPSAATSASPWHHGMPNAPVSSSDANARSIDEDEGLVPPRDANRAYAPPLPLQRPAPPPVAAPEAPLSRVPKAPVSAVGAATAALAAAILAATTTRTAEPEDDELWYVLRGGASRPRDLQRNTQELSDIGLPGQYGMSSTSARNMSVDQLAAVAKYPNEQISYTVLPEVKALGYRVVPTRTARNPLHASILLPPPETELTDPKAAKLSALFAPNVITNPYRSKSR
jgi:hypothetical protein